MDISKFYAVADDRVKISPKVKKISGGYKFRIKKSAVAGYKKLRLLSSAFEKRAGESGFYVFPGGTEIAANLTDSPLIYKGKTINAFDYFVCKQ